MPASELSPLIAAKSEDLGIEYKEWMDPADPANKAKLAKHIAALHNYGGGYLIFGVEDKTKTPLGHCPFQTPIQTYGEDAISAIVKKFLQPRFQCRVVWTEHDGVDYPVVAVPPHGAMPAIAIADGPTDAGKIVGIKQGALYIRQAGPESAPIRDYKDWEELLDRCLQHRTDKLASFARQAMGASRYVGPDVVEMLKEATGKTIADYLMQVATALPSEVERKAVHLGRANTAYAAIGYALVDIDGAPVRIEDPRALNDAVTLRMRSYAYDGYTNFLPLISPNLAPQVRQDTLAGREASYLEGARLENDRTLGGEIDVWRIYDVGIACTVTTFREDFIASRNGAGQDPVPLDAWQILYKLHRALAHARFMAEALGGSVANIVVRLDCHGIAGRELRQDGVGTISQYRPADDAFVTTVQLPLSVVQDNYTEALGRLARPLFAVFNLAPGFHHPLLDEVTITQQFTSHHPTFRPIPADAP